MFDIVLYFLRKNPIFFYTFLLIFLLIYSYFLGFVMFDISNDFLNDLFFVLAIFLFFWFLAFYFSFYKKKEIYILEYEKEKFDFLKNVIIDEYSLKKDKNIFEKIETIKIFVNRHFHKKSLLTFKILKVINQTLSVYIENLKEEKMIKKAISSTSNLEKTKFLKSKFSKIKEQNNSLLNILDEYIFELGSKNLNDKEVILLEFELKNTIDLLKNI
ncbi:hypothetical protein HMPREF9309_00038 [Campylobacter ureolyticus ACS-301-V-Sch3b]|uniref:Uncharacterized protein n=1 Tax=Campylobacter ureolyticus ACS-301-V-Sch3b TaxID=883165 RepID=S3XHD2_9BACT|nr:hypothetical protein [Campylobacter ureolyticus]EPH10259.1 hypothetical protein HMPREF9309_00038 [Campylobacter ureolyticus ACS-301-V-Sch3b]